MQVGFHRANGNNHCASTVSRLQNCPVSGPKCPYADGVGTMYFRHAHPNQTRANGISALRASVRRAFRPTSEIPFREPFSDHLTFRPRIKSPCVGRRLLVRYSITPLEAFVPYRKCRRSPANGARVARRYLLLQSVRNTGRELKRVLLEAGRRVV